MSISILQTSSNTLVDLISGTTLEYQAGNSRTAITAAGQATQYVSDNGGGAGAFGVVKAQAAVNAKLVQLDAGTLFIIDNGGWIEKTGGGSGMSLHLPGQSPIALPDNSGTAFATLVAAKLV
jgi:hypothetical protein